MSICLCLAERYLSVVIRHSQKKVKKIAETRRNRRVQNAGHRDPDTKCNKLPSKLRGLNAHTNSFLGEI